MSKTHWVVSANVTSDRALRTGARVIIFFWHGDFESAQVQGVSKGGRTIRKYILIKRLENFRPDWVAHPEKFGYQYETKESAQEMCNVFIERNQTAGVTEEEPYAD